jgi:1,4-alpha-glucan branching enzyme
MAIRGKKSSSRTVAPPRTKADKATEELQHAGGDVVPTVTVSASAKKKGGAPQKQGTKPAAPPPAPTRETRVAPQKPATKPEASGATAVPAVESAAKKEVKQETKAVAPQKPSTKPEASGATAVPAVESAAKKEVKQETKAVAPPPAPTRETRVAPQKPSTKPAESSVVAGPSARQSAKIDAGRGPAATQQPPLSLLTDNDLYLFNEGSHNRLFEKLGSHIGERDGVAGTNFAVWAPNAASVSVIGTFNSWDPRANRLELRGQSGIWEGFIPNVAKGTVYKYHIISQHHSYRVDKADPFGIHHETSPKTASIVWDLDYEWNDAEWMRTRRDRNSFNAPSTVYEVHLGSWRRTTDDGQTWRPMSYREIAHPLADYAKKMNFTHVELLPVMEHPFYGSWGYQCTGFFAPTSRYGTPQDFKFLVDVLHQAGIGVILDWVPSHFPTDEHGLSYFDGTHLFEHADPRKGFHPDWNSLIFNYGRNEVRSFLLSSAIYWLSEYHADGLRVDAVASMLYLDYSRKQGEWIPNEFGGRENIEAISFLRRLNEDVYKAHPDVQVIAEESTAWPMVSRPTYVGGLGFGMKWDMGWMHDTLKYFSNDPIHRKYHHSNLTFRMMYAFTENFVLPLSHDEVVHGKGSLIGKMPGDPWQKFANLRLLFAHMYSQPGKKLLFMGGEIGQVREWNHEAGLDWHLLDTVPHATLNRWVEDLNRTYRDVPALHELDISPDGFEWIDCCDNEQSVVSLTRRSKSRPDEQVVVVLNFTPIPRHNYMVGVPTGGFWKELLNSDAPLYGGSGQGNMGGVDAAPIPLHSRRWSVNLTLPPLGAVFLINGTTRDAGESSGDTEEA